MKIAVTQVVLGILIVFACVYIGSWMLFGIDSLFDVTVIGISGELVQDASPTYESLFESARYAFFLTLALGLTIIITGAAWSRVSRKRTLAIVQFVCGIVITLTALFIVIGGCSFNYIIPIEGGPVLTVTSVIGVTGFTGCMGLAIMVLAVIQVIKTRNTIVDRDMTGMTTATKLQ